MALKIRKLPVIKQVLDITRLNKLLGLKDRTVSPVKLWDTLVAENLDRYESERASIRPYSLYGTTTSIFSGREKVTYVYMIDQYPSKLELSFRKTLRRECRLGVRISFITHLNRDFIAWNSQANKNRLKTWKIIDNSKDHDNVTVYDLASEVGDIDSTNYKKNSLVYLINATLRRKRVVFNVQSMMLITGNRGESFDDTVKSVEKLCKDSGIRIKRVTGNIQDFLETYSPFSLKKDPSVIRRTGTNVVTDEIAARLNSYDQGTVGVGSLYWATDIYSHKSILKEPKEDATDAENWLVCAETGGGKSYLTKSIILQLLGRPDVVGTINDIEGGEYDDLGHLVVNHEEVVFLDVGESGTSYFDPVEIHSTGVDNLDKDMYALSTSFTLGFFKSLVGEKLLNERYWVEPILKGGIADFYNSLGAKAQDRETWKLTRGKTVFDVYESIKNYQPTEVNDEFKGDRQLVVESLENYLGSRSEGKDRFKDRIPLSRIRDAKLVINSFGMKGRSEQTVDGVDMALMQLYTAIISHLRSIFAYAQGKYNFKVWEEFQRWGGFPGSEDTLKTPLSGGRKIGDINIIVTNRPSELLETDRFKIFDSITTFAIGAVGDSRVRKQLTERLAIPLMLKELDTIEANRVENKNKGLEDDELEGVELSEEDILEEIRQNPHTKAFLFGLNKKDFAVGKVVLPDSLSNTQLFRTGVKKKDKD